MTLINSLPTQSISTMFSIIWALFLLAATAANVTAQIDLMINRIVGGETSDIKLYPTIVQIEQLVSAPYDWRVYCGATILSKRWLITAAHCVAPYIAGIHRGTIDIKKTRIRAGSTHIGRGGYTIALKSILVHPAYTKAAASDSDISLLELKEPLVWSDTVQPANIITAGFELADNSPVQVAGWGATFPGGTASQVLEDVTLYTVNNAECARRYLRNGSIVTKNMICAGILDVGGKDACQGDSGGPLYYNKLDTNILVGVVSWGTGCADAFYPGVFTKVSAFADWISKNAV